MWRQLYGVLVVVPLEVIVVAALLFIRYVATIVGVLVVLSLEVIVVVALLYTKYVE